MLFRIDAVRHATRSVGEILLVRPRSFSLLVGLSALVIGCVLAFIMLFSYSKKVEVSGVLLPRSGVTRVVANQPGVVAEIRVAEGDVVEAGEVVAVVRTSRSTTDDVDVEGRVLTLLRARKDSHRQEMAQIAAQTRERVAALTRKIGDLTASAGQIGSEIDLQQERTEIAEDTFKTFSELAATQFISKLDLKQRQADVLQQRLRLSELRRIALDIARERRAVEAELRDQRFQATRNEEAEKRQLAAVEQDLAEGAARREVHLIAPTRGIATAVTSRVGQSVILNQTMLAIVPVDAALEVELYAPSRAAGFISTGMPVTIRYQAYAFQRFGFGRGTVLDVARSALRPDELNPLGSGLAGGAGTMAVSGGEPLYRVRVAIDRQSLDAYGREWPLKPGSLIDASVHLERRRIIEWMFDPLLSISKRN